MSRTTRRKNRSIMAARRGPSLNAVLTGVVVLVAAAVIGGVLLADRSGGSGAPADALVPPDARTLSKAEGGEVTLVEFLDFQCPACASYYEGVTRRLEQDYQGRITFVTRNFPLAAHPLAVPAARAAEAAGRQGKYAEMYHALYDNFDDWAEDGQATSADTARAAAKFEEFAAAAGLDLERFRADTASAEVQAVIDRDVADGTELGVDSTPTFFLNGEEFRAGGGSLADVDRELRARIDAALAG